MSLTEKDKLIVAQVAVKGAVELAASGCIQFEAITDTAADLYAEVFNISALALATTAPAVPLQAVPAPTPAPPQQSLPDYEQAAQQVEQAFPGTQRTEPTGPPESPKDAMWRSALIDSPGDWWDNRIDKRNPRAPDFKAKNNGPHTNGEPAVLWIDSKDLPAWVPSHLATHS